MTNLILDNTYIILLLPLWIFLMIMVGRFFSVYVNNVIIYSLTLISSFLGIIFCALSLKAIITPIEHTFLFIKISKFSVPVGIYLDKLSLIIALVLFIISFLVQLFSIFYMKNMTKNYRFFALLNIFNFSMAGLLFSPNLFQMYAFWELVGIISYLLIGFEYNNPVKSLASKRVFIINRIGDTALIAGILLCSYIMYTYGSNISLSTLSFTDFNEISTLLYTYADKYIFILFIISAMIKSAQFPFHIWLQDAMEAKLPVSALLHSATMVVAGVYLIARILPFLNTSNTLMTIVSVFGITTALICSVLACIEIHPKKILAYSTSANLGLMFTALGANSIKAALILLVSHALLKSMLFLLLPSEKIISSLQAFTFLIGTLSLSGLILTGFISKEVIFTLINGNIAILYCIISFLGGLYLTRLYLIFTSEKIIGKTKQGEYLPALCLMLLTFLLYFYLRKNGGYHIGKPFYFALIGWVFVYYCQSKDCLFKFNQTPKIVEKICYNLLPQLYQDFANMLNTLELKFFMNYHPLIIIVKSGVRVADFIEKHIFNGLVTFITNCCKQISKFYLILQSGNVQVYNAYAFILATIVICLVIAGYTYILNIIIKGEIWKYFYLYHY